MIIFLMRCHRYLYPVLRLPSTKGCRKIRSLFPGRENGWSGLPQDAGSNDHATKRVEVNALHPTVRAQSPSYKNAHRSAAMRRMREVRPNFRRQALT